MSVHPVVKAVLISFFGFLLSLSAPGYDLWFIAWIGLAPLFIIINTSRKGKEAAFYSFLFGFAYNFWYLNWLFSIHPLNWLGFDNFTSFIISAFALITVAAYNSLFFVLFAVIVFYFQKISVSPYNKGIINIILMTFFWLIIFNKISSSEILLGVPWTLIEYSQYKNLYLIQMAEYFGSISISFLIVFFNLLLANSLIFVFNVQKIGNRYIPKDPGQIGSMIISFCFIALLLCSGLIYGLFLYEKNQQRFSNKSQTICVLQGNLPLKATRGNKQDIGLGKKVYSNLLKNNDAKLILIPEGALPTVFNKDLHTQYWLKLEAKKKQLDIISGSYCRRDEMITNCAALYSSLNNKFSYYEKERLVPFGEFTPFDFLLPGFLKQFAKNLIGDGFTRGKENSPVSSAIGKVGINICFELIFPGIIRKHILKGAELLVNISDLSWFSNDLAKQQFLSFGVFRAIENRKWLVIAVNSGISAFIEPNGKIRDQSLPNNQGVLLDWVNPNNKITFFAKYGW